MDVLGDIARTLRGRRVVALTGAGISTNSGIPDYRGPTTLDRARKPIKFNEFSGDSHRRRHYWSRSTVGWPRIAAARPNDGHRSLAALEERGVVRGVITQNVDRLHHKAGSRRVVELHGALADVRCLACGMESSRDDLQRRLVQANPGRAQASARLAPDGDADVPGERSSSFVVPDCLQCGGILKPKVVFFGEGVPKDVVADAWSLFEEAEALLVLGSSLTVYSGFRFVRRAAQDGIPIAIINMGETRGDVLASHRLDAPLEEALPKLAARLEAV